MELDQIKNLSDQDLISSLHRVFENERKISQIALWHVKEIDERRLFAERGFSSLFEMLIKEFKLSETSANQRLKALALLKVVPKLEESLLKGELNLTTLALAQRQICREEKMSGEDVSLSKKIEIVDRIKNKSQAQTEVELMRLLPNTASCPKTHERRISENMVRKTLNFPDRLIEKMSRLQEIWAHMNPSMEDIELIERSIDDSLSRVDPVLKANAKKKKLDRVTNQEKSPSVAQAVVKSKVPEKSLTPFKSKPRRIYFSVEIRQILWSRAGSICEYIDDSTKRRCCSKFGLEIDHRIPLAIGGTNDISNLRLLCQVHNLTMARRYFGDKKIDREIRNRTHVEFD